MNLEEHAHCLFAGSIGTSTALLTFASMEDMALRATISIIVGVTTWGITQLLSTLFKRKK